MHTRYRRVMIRSSWFLWLFVLGAFATAQMQYNEAPMLADMVARGLLPPVEERLPLEPVVVTPVEGIGTYGGTLRGLLTEQPNMGLGSARNGVNVARHAELSREDQFTVENTGIFADWDFADDYRSITILLREGMKWSDGVPLTADDYLFAWQDIRNNGDLTPGAISTVQAPIENIVKIDDHTIRVDFSAPAPHFWRAWGQRRDEWMGNIVAPAHYAKQFHIAYNPDADTVARGRGYQSWTQMFSALINQREWINPDLPVLQPWILIEATPSFSTWERNPYYWKVDTEGNQLPYIDRIVDTVAVDLQLQSAMVLSGEPDLFTLGVPLTLFPELQSRAEELAYDVWLAPSLSGSRWFLAPNKTYSGDQRYTDLFREIKFRQALSLAIDRDEINEVIHLGTGVPQQAAIPPVDPILYDEEAARNFAEHDPERAGALLDELGLDARNDQGYRTFPDGTSLTLVIDVSPNFSDHPPTAELVSEQLKDVGLNTTINIQTYATQTQNLSSGTSMIGSWIMAGNPPNDSIQGVVRPEAVSGWFDGFPWFRWCVTNGSEGEEAPAEFKSIQDRCLAMRTLVTNADSEENLQAVRDAYAEAASELNIIGTIASVPTVMIARNTLRNIPKDISPTESGWGALMVWEPWQLYLEGGGN